MKARFTWVPARVKQSQTAAAVFVRRTAGFMA
jgi:hypothetical protein